MSRKRKRFLASLVAIAAAALSGVAWAEMSGGDSSMNPFTGDSYAYFHGGHNLGEQAMIRPDRPPYYYNRYRRAPALGEGQRHDTPERPTARFRPQDTPPPTGSLQRQ